MIDRLLEVLATIILFVQDRLLPTLIERSRAALAYVTWLAFVPFFGFAGTHFQGSSGMDFMTYNVLHRRAVIQRAKGKTIFLYTVRDVGPLTYLRILDTQDIRPLLDHHAHEASWRWRWHGKLMSGRRAA